MKITSSLAAWTMVCFLFLPFVIGCGGDGDGPDVACLPPAFTTLSGDWSGTITQHTSSLACLADDGKTDNITFTLVQTGSAVTLHTNFQSGPVAINGTMCGNVVRFDPFTDSGTMTSNLTFTLSSATAATIADTWTWTDGVDTCTGSDTGTATKP